MKIKKIVSVIFSFVALVLLASCDNRPKLYILNWEEYINPEVVENFEKEFNVRVVAKNVPSNEMMYNDIVNRSGEYDIAIPSDYMIQRLYEEDLLHELDFSKLTNYDVNNVDPELQKLRDGYFNENQKYSVPYLWGTLGIMYSTKKANVKSIVEDRNWGVFFTDLPSGIKVGMYDSSRDALAAAQLHLGIDLNETDLTKIDEAGNLLKSRKYAMWGTDDLKGDVMSGNLDIALVYSGDFFDQYIAATDAQRQDIGLFVPTNNNVWFDAMVIPKTSKNLDLAHSFINFLLDEENSYENCTYIGHCPTFTPVYNMLKENSDENPSVNIKGYYPGEVTEGRIYQFLGGAIAEKMDKILTEAKVN